MNRRWLHSGAQIRMALASAALCVTLSPVLDRIARRGRKKRFTRGA